jgi:hypothetical protein
MNAWLITWVSTLKGGYSDPTLVAILSSRKSPKFIREFVQALSLQASYNAGSMAYLANRQKQIPFKPIESVNTSIICGEGPFLYARPVSELQIKEDTNNGLEIISWREPRNVDISHNGVTPKVTPGEMQELRRPINKTIQHDLCHRYVDRNIKD